MGGFGTATQITGEKKPAVAAGFDSPQTVNLSGASGRKRERLTRGGKNNKLKTDSSGHSDWFQVYCAVFYDVIPPRVPPSTSTLTQKIRS